jgi:hypothetical protein
VGSSEAETHHFCYFYDYHVGWVVAKRKPTIFAAYMQLYSSAMIRMIIQ